MRKFAWLGIAVLGLLLLLTQPVWGQMKLSGDYQHHVKAQVTKLETSRVAMVALLTRTPAGPKQEEVRKLLAAVDEELRVMKGELRGTPATSVYTAARRCWFCGGARVMYVTAQPTVVLTGPCSMKGCPVTCGPDCKCVNVKVRRLEVKHRYHCTVCGRESYYP